MVIHEDPQSIYVIILVTACGILYLSLCLGYMYLFWNVKRMLLLCCQGVSIFSMLAPMAVLCSSLGGQAHRQIIFASVIYKDTFFRASLLKFSQILCSFSTILTLRVGVLRALGIYKLDRTRPSDSFGYQRWLRCRRKSSESRLYQTNLHDNVRRLETAG